MNKTIQTIKKLALMALFVPFFFTSCSSDDNNNPVSVDPRGDYHNGVFVLNEGNSNLTTASIMFISDKGSVARDIFRAENSNAEDIGTFLQNIFFDDNNAYIVSGQANLVTIVDRYTFKYITTVSENLDNPRYGVVSEGKAFVTNSGDFSTPEGFITVINLSDYSTQKITLNTTAERIIEKDGKVYVSNGYFGNGNSITVIDAKTASVEEDTIDFGTGNTPSTITEKNGFIYAVTSKSETDQNWVTTYWEPMIHKINLNDNTVTPKSLNESIENPKNLTIENDVIYFTSSTSVYSLPLSDIDNTNVEPNKIFTYTTDGSMYGFSIKNNKIYIADVPDFSSNGKIYIYSLNGDLEATHTAGIGPNGFYFND